MSVKITLPNVRNASERVNVDTLFSFLTKQEQDEKATGRIEFLIIGDHLT